MSRALLIAREYCIAVQFADLGAWGEDELRSEYDPVGPVIRINTRVLDRMTVTERDAFVARAIGHELYHHREYLGEVPRLTSHALRERAADAFACALAQR